MENKMKDMSTFYILALLIKKETPLKQIDFCEELKKIYDISITTRTLRAKINNLNEIFKKLNIDTKVGYTKQKSIKFETRFLERDEIIAILDMIFSCKSLSHEDMIKLSKKLQFFLPDVDRENYSYINIAKNLNRIQKEQEDKSTVFDRIAKLIFAIENENPISFKYFSQGKNFDIECFHPNYLYFLDGSYYVAGYDYKINDYLGKLQSLDNFDSISNYKIDNLLNIKNLKEQYLKIETFIPDFDISKYINGMPNQYPHFINFAKIKIDHNTSTIDDCIDDIYETFKNNIKQEEDTSKSETTFILELIDEDSLIKFCLSHYDCVLLEPVDTCKKIKKILEKMKKNY